MKVSAVLEKGCVGSGCRAVGTGCAVGEATGSSHRVGRDLFHGSRGELGIWNSWIRNWPRLEFIPRFPQLEC